MEKRYLSMADGHAQIQQRFPKATGVWSVLTCDALLLVEIHDVAHIPHSDRPAPSLNNTQVTNQARLSRSIHHLAGQRHHYHRYIMQASLLSLPVEIRLSIYDLVFGSPIKAMLSAGRQDVASNTETCLLPASVTTHASN